MTNTLLRQVQIIELEITKEIERVCDQLGIRWFLDSGTLLGAARHQGFIPWDDDMDLGMMRADYEKFTAHAPALLQPQYELQTHSLDPLVRHTFAKVRRRGTRMVEAGCPLPPERQGIWVDVFPFDRVKSDASYLATLEKKWRRQKQLLGLRAVDLPINIQRPRTVVRKAAHWTLSLLPEESFYSGRSAFLEETTSTGGVITCFDYYTRFLKLPVEDALPLGTLTFEGYEMPVFRNWDAYLTQVYGDWEKLPPEEKRRAHSTLHVEIGADA